MSKATIHFNVEGVSFNARSAARKTKKQFIAEKLADPEIWPKVEKKIREKILGETWEKAVTAVKDADGDFAELATEPAQ